MGSGLISALAVLVILSLGVDPTNAHGRLLNPPSRSSMWRMGYKTPKNYNDNELFCGGLTRQQRNGMRCGICGDAFDLKAPRANEMGGRYYTGIISQHYDLEQVIEATVELTANHNGFFEFRVCKVNGNATLETEDCLQRNPLEVVGEGRVNDHPYRYYLPRSSTGKYIASLRLPKQFTCDHCVFQWTYTAGNNWGRCEDGRHAVGCGPQETFRGCADIAIGAEPTNQPAAVDVDVVPSTVTRYPEPPREPYRPPSRYPSVGTQSFPHWESDSAWPHSVRPAHAVESDRTPKPPRKLFPPSSLYPGVGTQTFHQWESNNAWPQSVSPGYPAESNRTTWFYHQWPSTLGAHPSRVPSMTAVVDLKDPQGAFHNNHHLSAAGNVQENVVPARLPHYTPQHSAIGNHVDAPKKHARPSRLPSNHATTRKHGSNTIAPENAPSLGDPVKKVGAPTTTPSPRPHHPYIHRTLPPVVSVETIRNEILFDSPSTTKPAPGKGSCVATGLYVNVPGMTDWCNQNCFFTPPFCPESHCSCT